MFPLRLMVSFLESPSTSPCWTHTEKQKRINYEKLVIVWRALQLLTAFKSRSADRPFLLVYILCTLVQDVEQDIGKRIEDCE
jgi:hypothetical protein